MRSLDVARPLLGEGGHELRLYGDPVAVDLLWWRREGFAAAEVERGEREQPAHLGRQRREGVAVGEAERGESEHPAHLGRQRREGCAEEEVERGEREHPAHLGRQRRDLAYGEVE